MTQRIKEMHSWFLLVSALLLQVQLDPTPLLVQSFTFQPATKPSAFFKHAGTFNNVLRPGNKYNHGTSHSVLLFSSSTNREKEIVVEAESLFSKSSDKDGLMTKDALSKMNFIAELLGDGDLLPEELDQIWKQAPKFPDNENEAVERIDVDSFVQIYRDIDDLFEKEDGDDDDEAKTKTSSKTVESTSSSSDDDTDEEAMEDELETIFGTICDRDGLLSKDELLQWDEIRKLLSEGLIDNEEFDTIWEKTPKRPGTTNKLDVDGFLSFNVELDGLFDFDDEDVFDDTSSVQKTRNGSDPTTSATVDDEGLSPTELFDALAGSDGLVGMEELKRWGDLQDMLSEGDLLPLELDTFFEKIVSQTPDMSGKLDLDGFVLLYKKIDSLFEEEEDEDIGGAGSSKGSDQSAKSSSTVKKDLLLALDGINEDEDRLPCGLESTEREQKLVQSIVNALEAEPANIVRQKQGAIEMPDLAGEWDLLYSSSSAMAYNKGLSGLGGSFPNGSFGGLKMKLKASKYMTDVEYIEKINVVPDSASFEVKVTGGWELRSSVSIFTGQPSTVLTVVPEKVTYGPTSTRADHWKSLGPTNMLDLTYLDEDLRIMRGSTSTDTIFVFKRTKSEKQV